MYRTAVNLEWTSKCNAACVMCPRDAIPSPLTMSDDTFNKVLERLSERDVFRCVIAGYGEPTVHPRFEDYVRLIAEHPVSFDMVSNGHLLDRERLELLDGSIGTLIISFSSVDPEVYKKVHVNLDHDRVMNNIVLAQKTLRQTKLAISLTPLPSCLETLPQTIEWLRGNGVGNLSMSPTLYDRAGTFQSVKQDTKDLRATIRQYGLHSQELDFVSGFRDTAAQWLANRFKCIPRNTDMLISAYGEYMYCFNDISHSHPIGNVKEISLRQALELREKTLADPNICDNCSIRDRYRTGEVISAGLDYFRKKFFSGT